MAGLNTPRERELQTKLKELERELKASRLELDEKASLLSKAKDALVELNRAFSRAKEDEEALREEAERVVDDQVRATEAAEAQVQTLESQLRAKTAEFKEALAAKQKLLNGAEAACHDAQLQVAATQAKLREKERVLTTVQEELAAARAASASLEANLREARHRIGVLEADLGDSTQTATELKATLRTVQLERQGLEINNAELRAELSASQKSVSFAQENSQSVKGEKERLEQEYRHRMAELEAACEARVQAAEKRLADVTDHLKNSNDLAERDWARRLQDVELHWEKRLRDGLLACEAKFAEEALEGQARIAQVEVGWAQRLAEMEQIWAARLHDAEHVLDRERKAVEDRAAAARAEAERALVQQAEQIKQQLQLQLEQAQSTAQAEALALEQTWSARLAAQETAGTAKFEAAQRRWANERATAAEKWAAAIAETEAEAVLNQEKQEHQFTMQISELRTAHSKALDAAQMAAAKERELLLTEWQARLEAAQRQADTDRQSIVAEMESKVSAITRQLVTITSKEGKRDACRKEMLSQLEDLQGSYEAELRRRGEAELAALNTMALYRSQLDTQRLQLDDMQRELQATRSESHSYRLATISPGTATPLTPRSALLSSASSAQPHKPSLYTLDGPRDVSEAIKKPLASHGELTEDLSLADLRLHADQRPGSPALTGSRHSFRQSTRTDTECLTTSGLPSRSPPPSYESGYDMPPAVPLPSFGERQPDAAARDLTRQTLPISAAHERGASLEAALHQPSTHHVLARDAAQVPSPAAAAAEAAQQLQDVSRRVRELEQLAMDNAPRHWPNSSSPAPSQHQTSVAPLYPARCSAPTVPLAAPQAGSPRAPSPLSAIMARLDRVRAQLPASLRTTPTHTPPAPPRGTSVNMAMRTPAPSIEPRSSPSGIGALRHHGADITPPKASLRRSLSDWKQRLGEQVNQAM